jgi:protein TonB
VKRVTATWRPAWAISIALYACFFAWLLLAPVRPRAALRPEPTRVRLAVAPPSAPAPPPPPPAAPAPRPRRMEPAPPAAPPAAPAPLLPASPPPPGAAPPAAPRRFAVSMEATVPGGGVAVPQAGPGKAPATRGVPGATGEDPDAPAFAAEPDAGPSLVSQPDRAELRALYPEGARRASLEGDVKLEIDVSERGEVVSVRVVRSAGSGFDEAAERIVRRFRFRPAVRDGRPVPARIQWTYKFRLEG